MVRHLPSGLLILAVLTSVEAAQSAHDQARSRVFIGDWWDYYNRALERIEARDWPGAEADLHETLRWRKEDSPSARTYGVHLLQYYPNRELGVVLHETGRFGEAVEALERSLSTVRTARAAYYLNAARRELLRRTAPETDPPTVVIESPPEPYTTGELELVWRGKANDSSNVSELVVGAVRVPLEVAVQEVPFEVTLPLLPGVNEVVIAAQDLLGNRRRVVRTVVVDRQGPVLALHRLSVERDSIPPRVRIEATAHDANGVAQVRLYGAPLALEGAQDVTIEQTLSVPPGKATLDLLLRDGLGNENHVLLDLDAPPRWGMLERHLSSFRFCSIVPAPLLLASAGEEPEIELLRMPGQRPVYLDRYPVHGVAGDRTGIAAVSVNGYALDLPRGTSLMFSYTVPLRGGMNEIVASATNTRGLAACARGWIRREDAATMYHDHHLAVAVPAFVCEATDPHAQMLRQYLLEHLVGEGRFQLVERLDLEQVLAEHRISRSQLADPHARLPAFGLRAADLLLVGHVIRGRGACTALMTAIDTAGGERLWQGDAFHPDPDVPQLRRMAEDLYLQLKDRFPLVEGSVAKVRSRDLLVTLGHLQQLRPGMVLFSYRLGPALFDPDTGMDLGREPIDLGRLRIQKVVEDRLSAARPVDASATSGFLPGDRVITR